MTSTMRARPDVFVTAFRRPKRTVAPTTACPAAGTRNLNAVRRPTRARLGVTVNRSRVVPGTPPCPGTAPDADVSPNATIDPDEFIDVPTAANRPLPTMATPPNDGEPTGSLV